MNGLPVPSEGARKADRIHYAIAACLFFFFLSLFFSFTVPVSDPDFWWHIATGKWMAEQGSLMHQDAFTIADAVPEDGSRSAFILKQYWLAQLIFYWAYDFTGFPGIIVLRALIFTLLFYLLFRLMRKAGAGYLLSVGMIYLSIMAVVSETQYIGDKPQMWSSLFSVAIIFLLWQMRDGKRLALILLPAVMLVWSNMHGGFILGVLIIGIYLITALIFRSGKKQEYIAGTVAVLASACNPNGWSAFSVFLPLFLGSSSLQRGYQTAIVEMQSIFQHARIQAIPRMMPHLTALFGISAISALLNIRGWRNIRKELFPLYLVACIMGFMAIRFIIFFVAVAALFSVVNLISVRQGFVGRFHFFSSRRAAMFYLLLAAVSIVGLGVRFSVAGNETSSLRTGTVYDGTREGVTGFIRQNAIRGNMFNDYTDGGYYLWRLYPEIKVFIDGRGLSLARFQEFRTAIDNPYAPASETGQQRFSPYYRKILDEYKVNIVAIPACDTVSGTLIGLAAALLQDSDWSVVYVDASAAVFLRRTPDNLLVIGSNPVPKTLVYEYIIAAAQAASQSPHARMMPNWQYAMAYAYNGLGDKESALRYLTDYLRAAPYDSQARMIKEEIEYEIRTRR